MEQRCVLLPTLDFFSLKTKSMSFLHFKSHALIPVITHIPVVFIQELVNSEVEERTSGSCSINFSLQDDLFILADQFRDRFLFFLLIWCYSTVSDSVQNAIMTYQCMSTCMAILVHHFLCAANQNPLSDDSQAESQSHMCGSYNSDLLVSHCTVSSPLRPPPFFFFFKES